MSTRKGLRRIPASEVVSSIEQDSLECLSSVSPACTSSPSLSPNPKHIQHNSLQETIEAELAARLQPHQDYLEDFTSENDHIHNDSNKEPQVYSTRSTLMDSLEISNYSLDSLATENKNENSHSNVEVVDNEIESAFQESRNNSILNQTTESFMQDDQFKDNYLVLDIDQSTTGKIESSKVNSRTYQEMGTQPYSNLPNNASDSALLNSFDMYQVREVSTDDLVGQTGPTFTHISTGQDNLSGTLDVIQELQHISNVACDNSLLSLDSVQDGERSFQNNMCENISFDPVQDEIDAEIIDNYSSTSEESILISLGSVQEGNRVINNDLNNAEHTNENLSEVEKNDNYVENVIKMVENEVIDDTSNGIISEEIKYRSFGKNSNIDSLSSPNGFIGTNINAELIIRDVLDSNASDGNPSLDVIERNHFRSLDASGNVTNDGIKSPMLDEFEKMEQAVEAEEKNNKSNGVDKKRKDGEKKKKKKKKKTESEKENKVCNQWSANEISSANEEILISETSHFPVAATKIVEGNSFDKNDSFDKSNPHSIEKTIDETEQEIDETNNDSLSGINVKSLTANYLNATDSSPAKLLSSPNDSPIRPKTPVSQLVCAYSPTPQKRNLENSSSYPSDFTPVASLKSLKSAYEACANKSTGNISCSSPVKEELSVSISQLRDSYCSAANGNDEVSSPKKTSNNISSMESNQVSSKCRICGKEVFQMEKIVAEKASWHKNCFRCTECNKQMTLETYQSHEGNLYCKPHFKELFRPKAVIQDEAEERKDRTSEKPDYGLEELQSLQSLNMKQRFSMFENANKNEEAPKLEHISVQRSKSLMSKAARFLGGDELRNGTEFDEEDEDNFDEDEDEVIDGEVNGVVKSRKKKERPVSLSGIGDLKNAWEQKHRREEMIQARKEEVGRFRQLICAGKNSVLKDMFENGKFENDDEESKKKVVIEVTHAAKSLRERFEKGQPFILEDEEDKNGHNSLENGRHEVEQIFKEAETAKNARNVFKEIDSVIVKEGAPVMRSKSFAQTPRDNRRSQDVSFLALQMSPSTAEVIKANEKMDDFHIDTTCLASRFNFFSTYEKRLEKEQKKSRKVFRITPPRDAAEQGLTPSDDIEVGRDPNLIKCTDKYEDDIDCKNTKNLVQMFRKMEMPKEEVIEDAPRPLKSFTPPPEGENYDVDSEYDGEYSEYTDEDSEVEDEKPKYKDEILEMAQSSQSAKKAANLRAKFERYESSEIEGGNSNEQESEECRPSIDTARNLMAMFESKAVEESRPVVRNPSSTKISRFV